MPSIIKVNLAKIIKTLLLFILLHFLEFEGVENVLPALICFYSGDSVNISCCLGFIVHSLKT